MGEGYPDDAGHALNTTLGQGDSMAPEDAIYLAKLLLNHQLNSGEALFAKFTELRQSLIDEFKAEA